MTSPITETVWLNTSDICSFDHVIEVSGLSADELHELIDIGIIEPSSSKADVLFFKMECIVVARKARQLRDDFELDARGVALALSLLRKMDELESEIARLRARLIG